MALPRGDQALSSLPSLLRIEAGSPKLQKSPPVERAHLTYDQTEVRGHRARVLQNKAAQAPDSLCPQGQSRGAVAGGEEPEQGRVPHCRLSKPPLLLHALVLEPDRSLPPALILRRILRIACFRDDYFGFCLSKESPTCPAFLTSSIVKKFFYWIEDNFLVRDLVSSATKNKNQQKTLSW